MEKMQPVDLVVKDKDMFLFSKSLARVFANHKSLGKAGKEKKRTNQFGDLAMEADIAAEEILLEDFSDWANKEGIRLRYRGEEIGEGFIGPKDGKPWFCVLDGLDGSKNYSENADWPYGTMVALAEGTNPKYKDFSVAGVMLPEEGFALIASIAGAYLFDLNRNKISRVQKFIDSEKYSQVKILANKYFPEEFAVIGENEKDWPMTGSTAASISAICLGEKVKDDKFPKMSSGWKGLIEVTRKGNLEQPVLYVLISTLGGIMIDSKGKSIGNYDFKSWGQKKPDGNEDRQILITAKNRGIAEGVLERLKLD